MLVILSLEVSNMSSLILYTVMMFPGNLDCFLGGIMQHELVNLLGY